MLRGAQKQMIVVRTHGSRVFEEACFVIRRGAVQADADEGEMLREANRIIENTLPPTRVCREEERVDDGVRRRVGLLAGLVWFFLGCSAGAGFVGFLWAIL